MNVFDKEEFEKLITGAAAKPPMMTLEVDEESSLVELILDTKRSTYGEWIKGEGGDICLYRDMETNKVVGCRLPLYQKKLMVFCGDESAEFG
jgi:hypothetical protein